MARKKYVKGYVRSDGVRVSEHLRAAPPPGKQESRAHDLADTLPSPTSGIDSRAILASKVEGLSSCTFYDGEGNEIPHEQAIYDAEDGEPVVVEKSLGDGLSGEANMAYILGQCGGKLPSGWEWRHSDNTLWADVDVLCEQDSAPVSDALEGLESEQVLDQATMRKVAHKQMGDLMQELEEEVVADLVWDYGESYYQADEDGLECSHDVVDNYANTVRHRLGTVRSHMAKNYGRYCAMDTVDFTVSDVKEVYRSLYGLS